jgi:hypothetical protein
MRPNGRSPWLGVFALESADQCLNVVCVIFCPGVSLALGYMHASGLEMPESRRCHPVLTRVSLYLRWSRWLRHLTRQEVQENT